MPREYPRFTSSMNNNAIDGDVVWSPFKSILLSSTYLVAVIGGYYTFSWSNFAVFLISTAVVLCFGHSLGMHRKLIHGSFECPRWLEYCFVYLGSLVGLGGPFTMIYTHDLRDWAQRQPDCHDYFAHRKDFFLDAYWQLHCDIKLQNPPSIRYEERVANDRFYRFIERTVLLQQLIWIGVFYFFGGVDWVIWGVFVRVAVSVTGHWLIGYFAHRQGHRDWHVDGAGVQGYNINFCGLITFGECWHNNHHAFPG